ncbi:unnamed protein product [Paramecium sonneborni]|uniref:Uncharacterized protein n=1 Tax=Paramecium sonneborni TaxID=65129 RepID=A0A8S1PRK7_9CILI|nr:unnamed protein product [Paramecium sonneborni]
MSIKFAIIEKHFVILKYNLYGIKKIVLQQLEIFKLDLLMSQRQSLDENVTIFDEAIIKLKFQILNLIKPPQKQERKQSTKINQIIFQIKLVKILGILRIFEIVFHYLFQSIACVQTLFEKETYFNFQQTTSNIQHYLFQIPNSNIKLWHYLFVRKYYEYLNNCYEGYQQEKFKFKKKQYNLVQFKLQNGHLFQSSSNYLNLQILSFQLQNCSNSEDQFIDFHATCNECEGPILNDCLSCFEYINISSVFLNMEQLIQNLFVLLNKTQIQQQLLKNQLLMVVNMVINYMNNDTGERWYYKYGGLAYYWLLRNKIVIRQRGQYNQKNRGSGML